MSLENCMAQCTSGLMRMKELKQELAAGGYVQFDHSIVWARLYTADHKWFTTLDGRTYRGFLKTVAPKLRMTATGSIETNDLCITWKP